MKGIINIDRALVAHPLVGITTFEDKPNHENMCLWIWLLTQARWKSSQIYVKGHPVKLDRGQFCASISFISKGTGLSIKQVRNRLEKFKKGKLITIETDKAQTIITICKYEFYQDMDIYKDKKKNQKKGNGGATEGQPRGKTWATNRTTDESTDVSTDEYIVSDQNIEADLFENPKSAKKPNGKIKNDKPKRKQRIDVRFPTDQDFPECPEKYISWAKAHGISNWQPEWQNFFNYWLNKQTGYVSWYRCWQNRIGDLVKYGNGRTSNRTGRGNRDAEGTITQGLNMALDRLGGRDEEPF